MRGSILIIDIILKLKTEGKTIIVTSHDREFLEKITDDMYIISEGMIKSEAK